MSEDVMPDTAMVRPLPGPGMVARAGDLLFVCSEGDATPMLDTLMTVAREGGDGVVLVQRLARVITSHVDGCPAACAGGGPTRDGRYAVVVWGPAEAEVGSATGNVRVSGADAITVVSRVVTGPTGMVQLQVPGAGPAQAWARLDSGVVAGAGVIYTAGNVAPPSIASTPSPSPAGPPAAEPAKPAAPGVPPPLRQPNPAEPFTSILLVDAEPPSPVSGLEAAVDNRVRVQGVLCKNNHFNDPMVNYCAICGISMAQQTAVGVFRPRPPLGLLLVDDGSSFRLDADYLVGRDPTADPSVRSGGLRPLRIADDAGMISRRHLHISLVGWEVRVSDLGSSNGTHVTRPGDRQPLRLVPNEPLVVRPGTRIDLGKRWIRYESNRNP